MRRVVLRPGAVHEHRGRAGRAAAVALAILASVPSAIAQPSSRPQPEVRVDAIAARATVIHAGVGAAIPVSRYVRLELVGAAGSLVGRRGGAFSARADGLARFVLDPEFSARWTAYAGGGVSARYDEPGDWRGLLVMLFGTEGPRWRGVVPFGEVGYGGGFRVGFGLRRAIVGRR